MALPVSKAAGSGLTGGPRILGSGLQASVSGPRPSRSPGVLGLPPGTEEEGRGPGLPSAPPSRGEGLETTPYLQSGSSEEVVPEPGTWGLAEGVAVC